MCKTRLVYWLARYCLVKWDSWPDFCCCVQRTCTRDCCWNNVWAACQPCQTRSQGQKRSQKFEKPRRVSFLHSQFLNPCRVNLHKDSPPAHLPGADKLPVFEEASFLGAQQRILRKSHFQGLTLSFFLSLSLSYTHKNPSAVSKYFWKSCSKRTARVPTFCLDFQDWNSGSPDMLSKN